jgi:alpha-galactosidase
MLELTLEDTSNNVTLLLYYTVFEQTDVITRRAVLQNNNKKPLVIRRLMSMMADLPNKNYCLVTFDGGWIKEAHRHEHPVAYGLYVNSSTTGASSNRHNPGFLLAEPGTTETHGGVYGFNLVYSGNHYGAVELSNHDIVRVQLGINPHCFEWTLNLGERFETPEAVMTYSSGGFNGLRSHFHDFVNNHIVRGDWKGQERPVLINNWEAHFFKFNQRKLLRLARRAKRLGIELFVLDDGWFGARNDDFAGLGDYGVNKRNCRTVCRASRTRYAKQAWRSGSGSSRRWLMRTATFSARIPNMRCVRPAKRPHWGATSLCSISVTRTCATIS